ncbi:GNAT family N-acetyltransferase [Bordetella genomosp. 13]|uniref:GNAT family N-acetyltransferase n=1 Tax=Bordetella genomosp. 13 TaxID=463040 RepID=UPI0011A2C732|nr:GNAT family N-acetyltransferase [Bordetella genomosp. 13]
MAHAAPTFRRATADDLPAIIALLADDVLGTSREDTTMPPRPGYVAAFEAIDRDPLHQLVVAEREGHIVGCLQLTFVPGLSQQGRWRGQVESVRIAAEARGTGLGRVMFEWAIAQCREHGCGVVQLTTDKRRADARRFYESLGFVASHEGMKLVLD